eukprot:m.355524 g.355524  ORF g.355524 m.355524 type:complete len:79 (-) comp17271_c0_seq1:20-256(-)
MIIRAKLTSEACCVNLAIALSNDANVLLRELQMDNANERDRHEHMSTMHARSYHHMHTHTHITVVRSKTPTTPTKELS